MDCVPVVRCISSLNVVSSCDVLDNNVRVCCRCLISCELQICIDAGDGSLVLVLLSFSSLLLLLLLLLSESISDILLVIIAL